MSERVNECENVGKLFVYSRYKHVYELKNQTTMQFLYLSFLPFLFFCFVIVSLHFSFFYLKELVRVVTLPPLSGSADEKKRNVISNYLQVSTLKRNNFATIHYAKTVSSIKL